MNDRRDTEEYRPIDCSLHDRFEAWAVLRTELVVEWTGAGGLPATAEARIVDIRVEGGAEYLVLSSGPAVRMDRITRIEPLVQPSP